MKIKIVSLIIIFKLLSLTTAFAQEKEPSYYLKIYGGYGLFTPGSSTFSVNSFTGVQSGSTGSYSNTNHGLGAGFNYGFGVEKTSGKFFSFGIDLNYLSGKAITSKYEVTPPASSGLSQVLYEGTASHSVLSVIPNVSFKVYQQANYYIYTRLGIIAAIKTKYQFAESYFFSSTQNQSENENYNQIYKYGLNTGLNAAAGIRFKIYGPLKGTIEVSDNFLAVSPKSSTANAYAVSGNESASYSYSTTYNKSNTGSWTSATETNNNGNATTYNTTETQPSITQHINNIILTFGIAVGIK
jgi:hypothetical protein